jgi:hypothetical protein
MQNIKMSLGVFEIIKNKIIECNYKCLVKSIVINSNLGQTMRWQVSYAYWREGLKVSKSAFDPSEEQIHYVSVFLAIFYYYYYYFTIFFYGFMIAFLGFSTTYNVHNPKKIPHRDWVWEGYVYVRYCGWDSYWSLHTCYCANDWIFLW